MSSDRTEQPESLFSVTPARRRAYLVAFILFSLIGYAVVLWRHVSEGVGFFGAAPITEGASAAATLESVMLGFAVAHAAALGLALTTAEITGGTMVLADYLREKLVTPLKEKREAERQERIARLETEREQRRAEGRAEANRNWREWNRRRVEAVERGEPFNEPEPYQDEE